MRLNQDIYRLLGLAFVLAALSWAAISMADDKKKKGSSVDENVLFVVDRSGSMTSQLPSIKAAVSKIVGSLKPNHRAGLLAFDGCTEDRVSMVVPMRKRAGRKIVAALGTIRAQGATALAVALTKTKAIMETLKVCPRLVLFTDNQDTCGGNVQAILDEFKSNREKYCLELDVVSSSEDEQVLKGLQDLANELGGDLYQASEAEDVLNAIQKILAKAKRSGDGSVRGTDKKKDDDDNGEDPNGDRDDDDDDDDDQKQKDKAKAKKEKDQDKDQEDED